MFADGDKDLSSHVATLLGAGGLVFDVNTSSAPFNEQLRQLHDGCQTSMASVRIRDDGTQVVDIGQFPTLLLRSCNTLLALFAVMEQLSQEKLVNLVGNGVLKASS